MARRPSYPRITTANNGQGYSNHSSSRFSSHAYSPSGGQLGPPTPSSGMVNSRKRSRGETSRGESPPDKRSRPPERFSKTVDRYASPESSSRTFSPPSRHNSTAGLQNVPTGPKNRMQDERHHNKHKPTNENEAQERRLQNGVTRIGSDTAPLRSGNFSDSPILRTNSPMLVHGEGASDGSEGFTPSQVAPPAPSMFPVNAGTSTSSSKTGVPIQAFASIVNLANAENRNSRLEQQESGQAAPATMASLRYLREKKISLAKKEMIASKKEASYAIESAPSRAVTKLANSEVTNDKYPQISSSMSQGRIKALEIGVLHLQKERDNISNKIKELRDLPKHVDDLSQQLKLLGSMSNEAQELKGLPKEVDALSQKFRKLESTSEQMEQLDKIPNIVQNLESLSGKLEDLQSRLENLESLEGKFEALSADVRKLQTMPKQIENLGATFSDFQGTITSNHKQKLECIQNQAKTSSANSRSIEKMKSDIDKLRQWKEKQPSLCTEEQVDKKIQLAATPIANKVECFLQSRIDELEKRLDRRFQESPQNNSTDLVIKSLQDDVKALFVSKEQTERDNFLSQLQRVKDRIEMVAKNEGNKHKKPCSTEKELESLRLTIEILESFERTVQKETQCIRGYVTQFVDSIKAQQENSSKTILNKIDQLERSKPIIDNAAKESLLKRAAKIENYVDKLKKSKSHFIANISRIESRLSEIEGVSARVSKIETTIGKNSELRGELVSLQERVLKTESFTSELNSKSVNAKLEEIGQLGRKLSALETTFKNAERNINNLHTNLSQVERDTHHNSTKLETLQPNISTLFLKHLEPIKVSTNNRLEDLNTKLISLGNALKTFQQQSSQVAISHVPQVQPSQASCTTEEGQQLKLIVAEWVGVKKKLDNLQTALNDEKNLRTTTIGLMKQQVVSNTDLENRLNILINSLQSLEDRYNNISSDELHKQMVDWFVRSYPTAEGLPQFLSQFLPQLQELQQSFARLDGNVTGMQPLVNSNAAQMEGLNTTLASLQETCNNYGERHIQELDNIKNYADEIEQACVLYPQIILAIGQLRVIIEDINFNLPGGGILIEWSKAFEILLDPKSNNEVKGKSRP